MPIAIITTILIHPFFRWFEETTGIETFGHSGPSDWCYLLVYLVFVGIAVFIANSIKAAQRPGSDLEQ